VATAAALALVCIAAGARAQSAPDDDYPPPPPELRSETSPPAGIASPSSTVAQEQPRRPPPPTFDAPSYAPGPSYHAVPRYDPAPYDAADEKSPGLAAALGVGATVLPAAAGIAVMARGRADVGLFLFSSGLIVGPSVGHFYSGEGGRGGWTAATRLAVYGTGVATTTLSLAAALGGADDWFYFAGGTAIAHSIAGLSLTVWGMVDGTNAAHRSNERRREASSTSRLLPRDMAVGPGGVSATWAF
jgi:hypothetical protein